MADESTMRRFQFIRTKDVSGVSGTGVVAEGVEFSDGSVAIKWLTHTSSMGFYQNIKQVVAIHGHEGCGDIEWLDEDPLEVEEKAKKPTRKKKRT